MCALDAYNPPGSKTLFSVEHNLLPFFLHARGEESTSSSSVGRAGR